VDVESTTASVCAFVFQMVAAAQAAMAASPQSLRITRLSSRRDMSTLLAQSAVQVCLSVRPFVR
jgi:hypothetical protein